MGKMHALQCVVGGRIIDFGIGTPHLLYKIKKDIVMFLLTTVVTKNRRPVLHKRSNVSTPRSGVLSQQKIYIPAGGRYSVQGTN